MPKPLPSSRRNLCSAADGFQFIERGAHLVKGKREAERLSAHRRSAGRDGPVRCIHLFAAACPPCDFQSTRRDVPSLEHDPEKWKPVFGQIMLKTRSHCPTNGHYRSISALAISFARSRRRSMRADDPRREPLPAQCGQPLIASKDTHPARALAGGGNRPQPIVASSSNSRAKILRNDNLQAFADQFFLSEMKGSMSSLLHSLCV
jgi:hypothetical protein